MASQRKIEAARRNGAKSRGPVTPEGKARSRFNALRHGFTSHRAVLLCNENEDDLREFSEAFFDRFLPATPAETLLVEDVIASGWRLRRLWSIETALFDVEMLRTEAALAEEFATHDELIRMAVAFESLANRPGNPLHLLHRYATQLRIQHHRAIRDLEALQAARLSRPEPPNEPKAGPPDAVPGTAQPQSPNEPTTPPASATDLAPFDASEPTQPQPPPTPPQHGLHDAPAGPRPSASGQAEPPPHLGRTHTPRSRAPFPPDLTIR